MEKHDTINYLRYRAKTGVYKPIPCPLLCCNDREECKDIDHPSECRVWKLVFGDTIKSNKNRRLSTWD